MMVGKNQNIFVPRDKGESRGGINREGHEELSFLMVKFHILIEILVTDVCMSQNSANIHLRFVYYTKYKFCIKREKQIIEL